MKHNIEFVNFSRSENLENIIVEKLEALSQKYDWLIRAEVFLKDVNKAKLGGQSCEVRLSLPGPQIFASAEEEKYEVAISKTFEALEKQLRQRKEKMKNKKVDGAMLNDDL